jgi:hypothetical protein
VYEIDDAAVSVTAHLTRRCAPRSASEQREVHGSVPTGYSGMMGHMASEQREVHGSVPMLTG